MFVCFSPFGGAGHRGTDEWVSESWPVSSGGESVNGGIGYVFNWVVLVTQSQLATYTGSNPTTALTLTCVYYLPSQGPIHSRRLSEYEQTITWVRTLADQRESIDMYQLLRYQLQVLGLRSARLTYVRSRRSTRQRLWGLLFWGSRHGTLASRCWYMVGAWSLEYHYRRTCTRIVHPTTIWQL